MGVINARSENDQRVSPGGEHVAEMRRAAVPDGRDHGYLTRRLSSLAVFGCTCGEFAEGPAAEVVEAFRAHTASDVFRPVDG